MYVECNLVIRFVHQHLLLTGPIGKVRSRGFGIPLRSSIHIITKFVLIVSTQFLFIRRVGEALVSCAAREMTVFSFVCPVMDIDVVAREFEFDIVWISCGNFR